METNGKSILFKVGKYVGPIEIELPELGKGIYILSILHQRVISVKACLNKVRFEPK